MSKGVEWLKRYSDPNGWHLHQDAGAPNHWSVRWRPADGKPKARRFHAGNLRAAMDGALAVMGIRPATQHEVVGVYEAFEMTVESSRRTESKKTWKRDARRFMEWVIPNYPGIENWNQLTRAMLPGYRKHLVDGGCRSFNCLRLRFQPIKQTTLYMARNFGMTDFANGFDHGGDPAADQKLVYVRDVVDFLDFLRVEYPWIEAGVALMGLAGMDPSEVRRLTWAASTSTEG